MLTTDPLFGSSTSSSSHIPQRVVPSVAVTAAAVVGSSLSIAATTSNRSQIKDNSVMAANKQSSHNTQPLPPQPPHQPQLTRPQNLDQWRSTTLQEALRVQPLASMTHPSSLMHVNSLMPPMTSLPANASIRLPTIPLHEIAEPEAHFNAVRPLLDAVNTSYVTFADTIGSQSQLLPAFRFLHEMPTRATLPNPVTLSPLLTRAIQQCVNITPPPPQNIIPQNSAVPTPISGRSYLTQLEQSYLTPLTSQIFAAAEHAGMTSLEVIPTNEDSIATRKRKRDLAVVATPATKPVQAETEVSPSTDSTSKSSNVVVDIPGHISGGTSPNSSNVSNYSEDQQQRAAPPVPRSRSISPQKKANVKKQKRVSDSTSYRFPSSSTVAAAEWESILDKAASALLGLLNAYEDTLENADDGLSNQMDAAIRNEGGGGGGGGASLQEQWIDPETQLPHLRTISGVSRHLHKVVEAGKGEELLRATTLLDADDDNGAGGNQVKMNTTTTDLQDASAPEWLTRFLKMCETVLARSEAVPVPKIASSKETMRTPVKNKSKETPSSAAKKSSKRKSKDPQEIADDVRNAEKELHGDDEEMGDDRALEEELGLAFEATLMGLEVSCIVLDLFKASCAARSGKYVYSEDLLQLVVTFLKQRIDNVLQTSLELSAAAEYDNSHRVQTLKKLLDSQGMKMALSVSVDRLCLSLKVLSDLLCHEKFSDSVIVKIYSASLLPFFWENCALWTQLSVERIQSICISVLRPLFANFPSHRSSIMDDIVGSLLKLPSGRKGLRAYKLQDGKSIQMVTALVVQLVQSCGSGSKFTDVAETTKIALSQLELSSAADDRTEEQEQQETSISDRNLAILDKFFSACRNDMEQATQCAFAFLKYLLNRSFAASSSEGGTSKRKADVGSVESEHKVLLDNFMKDVLSLLGDAEWPAAETFVSVFNHLMLGALDEKKHGDTVLKAVALEWVAEMIIRIRSRPFLIQKQANVLSHTLLRTIQGAPVLDEVKSMETRLPGTDTSILGIDHDGICDLWEAQSVILSCLGSGGDLDAGLKVASLFHISTWCSHVPSNPSATNHVSDEMVTHVANLVKEYCDSILSEQVFSLNRFLHLPIRDPRFTCSQELINLDYRPLSNFFALLLQKRSTIFSESTGDLLLSRLLAYMDSDAIMVRSRSLRALADVISKDHDSKDLLSRNQIRPVIASRLLDQSKSVRDSAVELVGYCMLASPGFMILSDYHDILMPRILDVGPSVRKRVIKLMKDVCLRTLERSAEAGEELSPKLLDRLVDVSFKVIGRLQDEEETIRDLASKSIVELWFSSFKHGHAHAQSKQPMDIQNLITNDPIEPILLTLGPQEYAFSLLSSQGRREVLQRTSILVGIAGVLSSTSSLSSLGKNASSVITGGADPIGDMLTMVVEGKVNKASKVEVVGVARSIVEALASRLLAIDDKNQKEDLKNILILLFQFARVMPCLAAPHLRLIHPYLKSGSSGDTAKDRANEERIVGCASAIFGCVIPFVKDPDMVLLNSVESDLVAILTRRSISVIVISASSLCAIVGKATKNYSRLTRVFKMCFETLKKTKLQAQPINPAQLRSAQICLTVIAPIMRYFNLDSLKSTFIGQASSDITAVAPLTTPLLPLVYEMTLHFAKMSSIELKSTSLQALGHLFVAQPKLMLRDDAQAIMASVFKSGTLAHKVELIKVFAEFLRSEQFKAQENNEVKGKEDVQKEKVNINVLIGNAEEMGDFGVSSAVMQMYLNHILDCVVDLDPLLSATAFDVVSVILEQGLAHPVLCLPHVIAMQTSPMNFIRDRACAVYDHVAEKHQTLIHTKNFECVRQAFEYQRRLKRANQVKDESREGIWIQGFKLTANADGDSDQAVHPIALLSRLYSKVQVKKNRRNEFLATLVKSFDSGQRPKAIATDISLSRFIVDNLATFDYTALDEVFHVVYHIFQVLSVTGESTLKAIEEWNASQKVDDAALPHVATTAILMAMLITLKQHLQQLYGLSDSICRKYQPSDYTRSGEKTRVAVRQQPNLIINWSKLPHDYPKTREEMLEQCNIFASVMHTDYYHLNSTEDEDILMHDVLPEISANAQAAVNINPTSGMTPEGTPFPTPTKTVKKPRTSSASHPAVKSESNSKSKRRVTMNAVLASANSDDSYHDAGEKRRKSVGATPDGGALSRSKRPRKNQNLAESDE